jgi:hypothetical protein
VLRSYPLGCHSANVDLWLAKSCFGEDACSDHGRNETGLLIGQILVYFQSFKSQLFNHLQDVDYIDLLCRRK